jgi:hypothetical protein
MVVAAVAFAAACAAGAERPPPPRAVGLVSPVPPAAVSRVRTTGRGRAPGRSGSAAQQRLMAKRAAVVEAYKSAAKTLAQSRSGIIAGTGSETVSGFVRGVEVMETRYYRDGDVEVDVEFMVPVPPAVPAGGTPGSDDGLVLVEKGGGPMREEEWREILGGGDPRTP